MMKTQIKTRLSKPRRRLLGITGILLIIIADIYFLIHFNGGYWNGLFAGLVATIGVILCIWWMLRD